MLYTACMIKYFAVAILVAASVLIPASAFAGYGGYSYPAYQYGQYGYPSYGYPSYGYPYGFRDDLGLLVNSHVQMINHYVAQFPRYYPNYPIQPCWYGGCYWAQW